MIGVMRGRPARFQLARRRWRRVHIGHLGSYALVCPAGCLVFPDRRDMADHKAMHADQRRLAEWAGLVSERLRAAEIHDYGAEVLAESPDQIEGHDDGAGHQDQ